MINYKHRAIFVPSNFKAGENQKTKEIEFETQIQKDKKDLIQKSYREGRSIIDKYALRKYWELAGGRTTISGSNIGDPKDVENNIKSINGVRNACLRDPIGTSTIICVSGEDNKSLNNIQKKIRKKFGSNIPTKINSNIIIVQYSKIWSHKLELSDLVSMKI